MKKIVLLIFLILTQAAFGAIELQGSIDKDTIVGGVGEEVRIIGNLIVDAGKILTIKPGTKVRVSENVLIDVYGTVVSEGTKDNPIVYDCVVDSGYWSGFRYNSISLDSAETSTFKYSIIKHAKKNNGGAFYINNFSNIEFNNVTIDSCVASYGGAIYANKSDIVLDSCKIRYNKASGSYSYG